VEPLGLAMTWNWPPDFAYCLCGMLYLSSIVQPVAGEPQSANFNHQNICNKRVDRRRTRMKRLRRRSILSVQRLNPQLLFDARTVGAQASTAVTSKTLVIQACAWLPITVRGTQIPPTPCE
jgi:hypothetical protein